MVMNSRMRIVLFAAALCARAETPALAFEFFNERVQAVFLTTRPGHARCVTCPTRRVPALETLAAGALNWSEEQSRKNFTGWKLFVVPGSGEKSRLLQVPLAHAAGGN